MALSTRQRWIAYGIAAAATAGAMIWVERGDEETVAVVAAVKPARQPFATGPAAQPADNDGEVRLDRLRRGPPGQLGGDPFGTLAPPPPPPAQAAPPAPPPVPQAPPLPFSYLGRWTEKGVTTVFLAHGDQHVAVKGPGKLDANYAVEAIDEHQVVLTYLPLGIRQVLAFNAPAAPAAAAARAAAAPAPEDNNEETN